jgi:hypothetical protein
MPGFFVQNWFAANKLERKFKTKSYFAGSGVKSCG